MRQHRIPIGWPRRDPRRYRFPLPNAVWEYRLKPVEFVIFSCLCYYTSRGQTTEPTPEMVAESIHLSANTTKKYLVSLVDRGLITTECSLTLDSQRINSKNFFTLPNEMFLLRLPPSAFMVYAYLMLIEDRCVYIYPDADLRLYPGILRGSPQWAALYAKRTAVERSIASFKYVLGTEQRNTFNSLTTKADVFLAGIVQLLCVLLADALCQPHLFRRVRRLTA